jgi:galactitol-specific phosphotransferase system IIB component
MKYTNELLDIDTQEKAYLLGLFYSDGYVTSSGNACAITLHEQDIDLLEDLVLLFPFFRLKKSHARAYKMICVSKTLKEHLINNGVFPKKSSVNKDLLTCLNVKPELTHHFIRGFFDGDGSVWSQKLFNIKIEIGGTSFGLITEIIKILYDNRITVNFTCCYAGSGLRTMDYYKLFTSSYKISKQFADYIYKDSTIHMSRKFLKLNVTVEYDNRKRVYCPCCNSNNTIYNGVRNGKTRITCKDCKKHSSILTAPHSSNIVSGEGELLED